MSVRMSATRGHTRNRRSHHALKGPRLSVCKECNAYHLRHRMCEACGIYRGNTLVDTAAKDKKKETRTRAKAKARGVDQEVAVTEEKKKSAPRKPRAKKTTSSESTEKTSQ